MSGEGVAYDPYDPVQRSFLGALAQGESGGFSNSAMVGYGGGDLSAATPDQYGFPQWNGVGNTHAAGTYQFQPGTWKDVASKFGLNFQNPADQDAGAWYTAQAADPNLESDLSSGAFGKVQAALSRIWPSVSGSASNPTGLAGLLGSGADTSGNVAPLNNATGDPKSSSLNPFAVIENWFLRGGLIIVGVLVIMVALYFLLRNKG